jgi:DNA-directed RNA polymerase subunit RPC12/RpoP
MGDKAELEKNTEDILKCETCGDTEFKIIDGNIICSCCGSKIKIKEKNININEFKKEIKEETKGINNFNQNSIKKYLNYEENASRVELIVRIFYSIVLLIVLSLYGIVSGICYYIQWILILILGKRFESINNIIVGYIKYNIQILSYVNLITDERPGIGPKKLDVYINNSEYLFYEESASRVELIVRIFYLIPLRIVIGLYYIVASICLIIQWILILILGKRFESINNIIVGYIKYNIQILSYVNLITDERPGIGPKLFDIDLNILD